MTDDPKFAHASEAELARILDYYGVRWEFVVEEDGVLVRKVDVFFDDDNVYVTMRAGESQPDRLVAKEMRRDNNALFDGDVFMAMFDTFYDRRNGFVFHVNLSGGFSDAYLTEERDYNRDWNTVWDNRVARFDRGWSVEMAIPFKSLRYPGRAAGEGPDAEAIARIKGVLGSSLAALGDRLFWFTLRPVAACAGVWLALDGRWYGALAMALCYNLLHLGLRLTGVRWGYRAGPGVLGGGVRLRFERLTRTLAVLGTCLIGGILAWLVAPSGSGPSLTFEAALGAGLGIGLLGALRSRPTPTEWALGLGALCLLAAWFR